MPKSRTQAIGESIAHVLGLGVVAGAILGPVALGLIFVREFASKDGFWRWLPWPYRGQMPPRSDRFPVLFTWKDQRGQFYSGLADVQDREEADEYWAAVRVRDTHRDLIEMVSGWTVGQAIQIAVVLWLVWPAPTVEIEARYGFPLSAFDSMQAAVETCERISPMLDAPGWILIDGDFEFPADAPTVTVHTCSIQGLGFTYRVEAGRKPGQPILSFE